jgi:hypothetical protein
MLMKRQQHAKSTVAASHAASKEELFAACGANYGTAQHKESRAELVCGKHVERYTGSEAVTSEEDTASSLRQDVSTSTSTGSAWVMPLQTWGGPAAATTQPTTQPEIPASQRACQQTIDQVVRCASFVQSGDGSSRFQMRLEPGVLAGATITIAAATDGRVCVRVQSSRGVGRKDRELVASLSRRLRDAGIVLIEVDSDD